MEENNPVVLLSGDTWHIVEHSRKTKVALCGKTISDRRAHARYKQVGAAHVCPKCVKLFQPPGDVVAQQTQDSNQLTRA